MKSVIHINQHKIKRNRKLGTTEPVITVKDYKSNRYGSKVKIKGESTVVYQPHKPLQCGATAWIETQAEVEVIQ